MKTEIVLTRREFLTLIAIIFFAIVAGFANAAFIDYTDTQTMGVGMHHIQLAKAECESSGKECAMIWEFVEVEAYYQ